MEKWREIDGMFRLLNPERLVGPSNESFRALLSHKVNLCYAWLPFFLASKTLDSVYMFLRERARQNQHVSGGRDGSKISFPLLPCPKENKYKGHAAFKIVGV